MSATKAALNVAVFLGSVRPHRMADRMAKLVTGVLQERGHGVDIIDPKILKLSILETALHHYPDPSQAPQELRQLKSRVEKADAFVVLAPEYNASIPPALSNMLDHISPKSYSYRPVGIVSYSPSVRGGFASALQLRLLLGELGALTLPTIASFDEVHKKVDENGATGDAGKAILNVLFNQLEFVGSAIKKEIAAQGGVDKIPKVQPYV